MQHNPVSRRAVMAGMGALGLGLFGLARAEAKEKAPVGTVEVHICPYELLPSDKLSDGGKKPFEIKEPTLLVWVDSLPGGRYSHDTEYVLISASGTRVEKGGWWPVLNGKDVFHSVRNHAAVVSPVVLAKK